MNEISAIKKILEKNNWTSKKDEVGDTFLELNFSDRILSITPSIKKLRSANSIGFTPSISTDNFRSIIRQIRNTTILIAPLALMQFRPHKINELSEKTLNPIIDEILEWAKSVDINGEITRHAQLPTNSRGAMPLRHLAALALLGDTETLQMYRTSFKLGNRLDFVPYISIEMIERALEIAKANNAHLPR